jgi:hypothetical protein
MKRYLLLAAATVIGLALPATALTAHAGKGAPAAAQVQRMGKGDFLGRPAPAAVNGNTIQKMGHGDFATPPINAAPVKPSPRGTAFSWGDAGIGAAAWTGVLLVLLGGSLLALRRRGVLAH